MVVKGAAEAETGGVEEEYHAGVEPAVVTAGPEEGPRRLLSMRPSRRRKESVARVHRADTTDSGGSRQSSTRR
jgi:hypothetical protein